MSHACTDSPGWMNPQGRGYGDYAEWCIAGVAKPEFMWTLGQQFNYPERNCCVCGKGTSASENLIASPSQSFPQPSPPPPPSPMSPSPPPPPSLTSDYSYDYWGKPQPRPDPEHSFDPR